MHPMCRAHPSLLCIKFALHRLQAACQRNKLRPATLTPSNPKFVATLYDTEKLYKFGATLESFKQRVGEIVKVWRRLV